MNKRSWVLISGVALSVLVIFVPALVTLFFFQAYRNVGLGLSLLLLGGMQWYAGTKLRQAAKRRGEPLPPWWNHYLLVLALTWGCFGMLECLVGVSVSIKRVYNVFESGPGAFFGMLFVFLTLGVGIYGIILMVQHLKTIKLSRRPQ